MAAPFLDDVVFPAAVSRGSRGGPDWPAEIVTLASGREERNVSWSAPLRLYDVSFGVRTPGELYEVLELYHAAKGRLSGFRFQDFTDWKSCAPHQTPSALDQRLGVGNGVATAFPLVKRYSAGVTHFERRITRPFGTLLVAVNGSPTASGWTLNAATGVVTFAAPPAAGAVLDWGGTFHVPVRFDTRLDQIAMASATSGDIPSILLKELRE
jgi:uncharacterized protein (TIGR02217 family)